MLGDGRSWVIMWLGLFLPVAVPLAFTLYHLSRRQAADGRQVWSPAQVGAADDVSVVGIARPWEAPGISPLTEEPVLWSRAHSSYGDGPAFSDGKVATTFVLRDEYRPEVAIAVESRDLREVLVRTRGARGSSADAALDNPVSALFRQLGRSMRHRTAEERAIYPGERVWLHGPLLQRQGYLAFGKKAWLDDRPPERRVQWHTQLAMLGGGVTAVVAVLVTILILAGRFG